EQRAVAVRYRAAIPITWNPPSTWITSPVTPRESGDTRKSAASPTSSCSVFLRRGACVRWYSSILERPCTPDAAIVLTGHADAAGPEVRGEVAHRHLERGLGHAHHVVMRHHALAPEVGQGHDAPALRRYDGGDGPGQGGERIRGDVLGDAVAFARGVEELA